ncbi:MAG TPA: phage protein Gp37 [Sphingobium sp.]
MIAAIENAMLARLKAASDADVLGYNFRDLDSYPEDWDRYLKEKLEWRAPAAWVVFAGAESPPSSDLAELRFPASFFLVVAAENSRNETARRHGGQTVAEPGSYQLVLDAVSLLADSDLGLPEITPLVTGAIRTVARPAALSARNCSLLAVAFTTSFTLPLVTDLDGEAPVPFTDFHVNWDVPPFVTTPPLPADASADATDHVELPQ